MGNVYRYNPLFFLRILFYFLLILMNTQKRKFAYQHIEKKTYVWASIRYQGR